MRPSARSLACGLAAAALMTGAGARGQAAAAAGPAPPPPPPRGEVGHAMVAAANPLAAQAGLKVLRAGGSAVDAAVAVQAVLGLVEPQSSGLGGGAFMLVRDGRTGVVTSYDGRETAPASATPSLFLGDDGRPLPVVDAVLSGRSTGAPGAIAMLEMAHRAHGRLAWRGLFDDAARLSREGFTVSPRLAGMIAGRAPQAGQPDARRYFSRPDGTPLQAGDTLRNPLYADALARIADQGSAGLLHGPIAAEIAARVAQGPRPGGLSTADLAAYRPLARPALCRPWRGLRVCAPALPSGGVGLLELLGVLEATDIAARGPSDPQAWVEFAQASRLAYADRDRFEGDPAFVAVPVAGMLDPAYDKARAALIPTLGAAPTPAGDPPGAPPAGAPGAAAEPGGTSSFVIVDRWGTVVSATTTVESIFGSGRMVHGFFLNNQLTDFSFQPTRPDGGPVANAVAAGKRPRSSMTPVIVLDREGRFVGAVGSPGGNAIIAYVAKALVGVFDWRMAPQPALALPNLVARPAQTTLERGAPPAEADALRATGMKLDADAGEESGLQMVLRAPGGGYVGAADPRREGVARGW